VDAVTPRAPVALPKDRIAPVIRRLVTLFAVAVAVTLPAGYLSLKYSNLVERLETIAAIKADSVNALAAGAPEMWMFQSHRLEELLQQTYTQAGMRTTLRDTAGNLIFAVGEPPRAPVIVRTHAAYESGHVIAYVDVAMSYGDLLIGTLFACVLGMLFGGAGYVAVLALPLRVLQQVSAELDVERAASRESEARYQLLFNLNPIPAWVFDEETLYFLAVNDATVANYGWSRAEFLAMTIMDIRRPEDVPFVMGQLANGQRKRDHIVSRHRKKDGTQIDVEIRSHRVEFAGRAGRLTTAYDITARKRAEAELRESAAFRELLLEAIPLPVFYKDAARRYTGCNSAFTRFIGKRSDEVIGKTVFEVAPGNFAHTYQDKDLELLEGEAATQVYEGHVMHADGTPHDVIFHKARMIDDAGRPTGIIGGITDITDNKRMAAAHDQLQAQLRESQKMEALGTLAGGVAHDFNNIIAMINGNAVLAREDLGPAHPALDSLAEILKASARAKDLVQQILAFGRRQLIERKVISLVPVVDEASRLLRATLPARVSLRAACAPHAPMVLADKTQIEQVLINLCTNAWQAMHGQAAGSIEIRLQAHEQAAGAVAAASPLTARDDVPAGRYALLSVSDDGPGMNAQTCARIFEPFFTTKPVGEGTGLGLSVVHGIVQAHGATVKVQSAPGKGTTFRLYFPAVDDAVAQRAEEIECAAADQDVRAVRDKVVQPLVLIGEGRHVLYVDDDEALVFLVQRLLERRGFRVSSYIDQRAALTALRAAPASFDLVVTDYNMPGMSGLDVAREVRAIRADLPLAVVSGFIDEELHQQSAMAGVREVIFKADLVEDLCESIARLVTAVRAGADSA
jgi:PAS domain S-box-containing protein